MPALNGTVRMSRPKENQNPVVLGSISMGSCVYIPCQKEGWTAGIIVNMSNSTATVETLSGHSGQKETISLKNIEMRNNCQDLVAVSDLTALQPISTPSVLDCLHKRYNAEKVYTKAGSTLVAVNPFMQINTFYGEDVMFHIHSKHSSGLGLEKNGCPHVYEVADRAYSRLQLDATRNHQSIIVSGESGAGKTVSARHVMKYLVSVSTVNIRQQNTICSEKGSVIERRILDTNPILEAFGNAATTRNLNSSRFGKFIELHFDSDSHIVSASVKTYLLEKCRVIHQAPQEYNFHIFYQLLHACQPLIGELIGDVIDGDILTTFNIANCTGRKSHEDGKNYMELEAALKDIGLTSAEITNIIIVLLSILLLCNLMFVSDEDDDVCYIDDGHTALLDKVCDLLGLSSSKLEITMTHRKIAATHARRKSVYHKPCSITEAQNRRNCIGKLLYDRLFQWIVQFINTHIKGEKETDNTAKIGILDIYGFESFNSNGLEQLCINYANEKLQQHFVKHFLRDLQEEYMKEAIPWDMSDYVDNRMCIELIENKPGVIALLDEECSLNRAIDNRGLAERLVCDLQGVNKHIHKATRELTHPGFMILHYAEPVKYNTEGLLDKNKDDIPAEIVDLLQHSENEFVLALMSEWTDEQNGRKKKTLLSKFKQSLDNLMVTLELTEPHYIRCIKPNTKSLPSIFDRMYVLRQLEACGVLETVNINKQAFSARMTYPEFLKHFSLILRQKNYKTHTNNNIGDDEIYEPLDILYKKQLDLTPRKSHSNKKVQRRRAGLSSGDHNRKLCATIMNAVFNNDHPSFTQYGKTQIFLKDGQLERLESARLHCLSMNAFTIQCWWHRIKHKQQQKLLNAVSVIQSVCRGWIQRESIQLQKEAVTVIQRMYRRYRLYHQNNTLKQALPTKNTCDAYHKLDSKCSCTDHPLKTTPKFENLNGYIIEPCDKVINYASDCNKDKTCGGCGDMLTVDSKLNGVSHNKDIVLTESNKKDLMSHEKSSWTMQSIVTRLCQRDVIIFSAVLAVVLILGK